MTRKPRIEFKGALCDVTTVKTIDKRYSGAPISHKGWGDVGSKTTWDRLVIFEEAADWESEKIDWEMAWGGDAERKDLPRNVKTNVWATPEKQKAFSVSGGDDDVRQTQDFVPHPLDNRGMRNTQNQIPNCGKGKHHQYETMRNLWA